MDSSPKNENSVIIYSPSCSSKPVWISLFCWTQRKILWRMWGTEQFWGTIDFHCIFLPNKEVNGAPKQPGYKLSSEYLPLCSADQINSYRFGTTWGWVNDKIFIFGWTIPLSICCECLYFTWVFKFQPTLTFTPLHILIKMYTFTPILLYI